MTGTRGPRASRRHRAPLLLAALTSVALLAPMPPADAGSRTTDAPATSSTTGVVQLLQHDPEARMMGSDAYLAIVHDLMNPSQDVGSPSPSVDARPPLSSSAARHDPDGRAKALTE